MRNSLIENKCTLFFEGELNSFNSENIYKDIQDTIKDIKFESLILDFENLSYISSAGLRIVLRLKQTYDDCIITNASLEVYDVLSMTGFTNIMTVKKALKRIYVDGAQIVGDGFFSTVYRINKDTIIKVFNRVSDPDQIERELKLAKQAFILGIPTAISFDIVKVDNKLGVRFEMLDCDSLKNVFLNNPDKVEEYIDKYFSLLKKINTTECDDETIPSAKAQYLNKLEIFKEHVDEAHYLKAKKLVESIPDRNTFVHGDCHFKNIMVQQNELLLIDMDTLSRGNPIFELSGIRSAYISFEEDDPGNNERFLGVPKSLCEKIYYGVLERYFGKKDETIEEKIQLLNYIHMVAWNRTNEPENEKRLKGLISRILPLIDKYDDLDLGL